MAALLSPRPPALLVLNEPETSLHPDLLPRLAHLVAEAARRSQVVVVSHARELAAALATADDDLDVHAIELVKDTGQTMITGHGRFEGPAWTWPRR